jgi:hypothetical protein
MPEPQKVEVGQVWADNDWRSEGRTVRVVEVDATHATVELVTAAEMLRGVTSTRGAGRRSRIRLDRFRPVSTGYRLVETPSVPSATTTEGDHA